MIRSPAARSPAPDWAMADRDLPPAIAAQPGLWQPLPGWARRHGDDAGPLPSPHCPFFFAGRRAKGRALSRVRNDGQHTVRRDVWATAVSVALVSIPILIVLWRMVRLRS